MTTTSSACQFCGVQVAAGSRFCANCGADVSAEQGNVATRKFTATQAMHDHLLQRLRHAALGEHEILTELGRGGMATVYLAHDIQLDRKVAIKVMLPSLLEGDDMVERFRLEARTAAQLSHPHIIPIYAVRTTEGLVYFVMKFVEGRPLDAIIRELGQLPVPMVRSILSKVGEALGYAHRRGVVHRDIKPANLMIDVEGLPIVTDFGIAKVADARGLTMTGAMIGTPTYMSPEQCSGGEITGASDQYSLGVVAYQMVAGKVPFEGDTLVGLLYKHCHDEPPPLREARPDCPPALEKAILRMLEKEPAARFPSMEAAVEAIGTESLAFDHPIRTQLINLAQRGENVSLLKRISTPSSPIPMRTKPVTGTPQPVGGAPGAVPEPTPAGITARSRGDATASDGTATRGRARVYAAVAALVVLVAVGVWLKPWARAQDPAPDTAARTTPPGAAETPTQGVDGASSPQPATPAGIGDAGPSAPTGTGAADAGGSKAPAAATVASVRIDAARATMTVGEQLALRARAIDPRGGELTERTVTWSSSDVQRARISRQGLVEALAPGEVTFTAEAGGVRRTHRVTIEAVRAATVALSQPAPINVGSSARLVLTVLDPQGRPLERDVAWRSSNPAVVTVNDGVVRGVSAGEATVTASVDGQQAMVPVRVTAIESASQPTSEPTTPPTRPAAPAADPRVEIEAAIERYERALESKQLSAIRAAYPGLTADQEATTVQALNTMNNLRVNLRVTAVNLVGDEATASVEGAYEFFSRDTRRNETLPVKVTATLVRGATGWQIRSIRN